MHGVSVIFIPKVMLIILVYTRNTRNDNMSYFVCYDLCYLFTSPTTPAGLSKCIYYDGKTIVIILICLVSN